MVWFVLFACTVFGLYFWREYRVQQQDLQSASSPLRTGERYILGGDNVALSELLCEIARLTGGRPPRMPAALGAPLFSFHRLNSLI